MSKFCRNYKTNLSPSVPFDDRRWFAWHFAAFQDLNSADAKLLAHSYVEGPIHSLKYIAKQPIHTSLTNLKEELYHQVGSYSERSVWQGKDAEENHSLKQETVIR